VDDIFADGSFPDDVVGARSNVRVPERLLLATVTPVTNDKRAGEGIWFSTASARAGEGIWFSTTGARVCVHYHSPLNTHGADYGPDRRTGRQREYPAVRFTE